MSDLTIAHIKTPKELGIALKRLRKTQDLTQKELSELIGIRQPTVSDIENGRGTLDSFFKLLQALRLNLSLSNQAGTKQQKNSKIGKMLNLLEE